MREVEGLRGEWKVEVRERKKKVLRTRNGKKFYDRNNKTSKQASDKVKAAKRLSVDVFTCESFASFRRRDFKKVGFVTKLVLSGSKLAVLLA